LRRARERECERERVCEM